MIAGGRAPLKQVEWQNPPSSPIQAACFSLQCAVTKCSVLVCWLGGRESLQKECLGLVRDLWAQGISADILYESMDMDNIEDIQKFCREYKIPHVVVLGDKALYFERKQVRQV